MKPKQAEPVHGIGPALAPVGLTLALALLSVVPLQIPGYAAATPDLVLMSVYHWTLYRPEYLPYTAVFLVGLFVDLLTSAPGATVGLTPLLLLVVRWVVLTSRRSFIGRHFPFVWAGFAAAAAAVGLSYWAVGSLFNGGLLEPRAFAFRTLLTVGLFPVATSFFAWVQRLTAAGG